MRLGSIRAVLTGNGVPLCACAVGAGGGQDITSLLGSTVSSVTNKTSCNGARRRPSGVTTSRGFVLLVHWDWLETQGWVPYDGGAVPDSVPEVGLGVVGTPILWRWAMLHTRMLGRRLSMAICMVGSTVGIMAAAVASLLVQSTFIITQI